AETADGSARFAAVLAPCSCCGWISSVAGPRVSVGILPPGRTFDTLAAFAPTRCPSSAFIIGEPQSDDHGPGPLSRAFRRKVHHTIQDVAPQSAAPTGFVRDVDWTEKHLADKVHVHERASRRSPSVGVTRALRTRALAVCGRECRRRSRRRQGIETSRTKPGRYWPFRFSRR